MPATTLIEILLVEDNLGDIRQAQETLRENKMQNALHVVCDGEEALRYLRQQHPYDDVGLPDLVLLDLNLPKIDGLEVLEEMQNDDRLRDLPVVILTATRVDEELLKRYRLPTDCFIMKPLTLQRYLDAVRCFPQFGLSIVKLAGV